MSNESNPETIMDKTILRIKKHPFVSMLLIVITVLIGIEATTKSISGLMNTSLNILTNNKNKPILSQFTLSDSASNYIEVSIAKFGLGSQVKTFMAHSKSPEANSLSARTYYPVFNVVIANPSNQQIVISKITYNVEDLGHVLVGGRPGPMEVTNKYTHKLEYKKGTQEYEMVPPITIPANSSNAFELAMITDHPDLALSWWTNVEFHSNMGNVSTDMFQLILSGRPKWAVKVSQPQQILREGSRIPQQVRRQETTIMPLPAPRQEGIRMQQKERVQHPRTPSFLR